ncbi:unnamed protein product [Phytophthora lilii]|uniref:Unnamed protein product n=1 Tax=Phytophthora lilii TaxID=2077276 RepID=A0A9W6TSL2_9STRA|nr:unnamed protein product [Phytophthora lilii]
MVRRALFSSGSGSSFGDSDPVAKPTRARRTGNNRRAHGSRRALEEPTPRRKQQPARPYRNRFDREVRNLDDSYATTAPAVSTRRDNVFDIDIPIISTRRNEALDSTCAVVDYDGALISSKAMRHGGGGVSINANSSVPSDDGTVKQGSIDYISCRHVGLVVSMMVAGLLNTCLKRGLLPLLQAELELETYQVDAAGVLMLLPWSYTFV